MFLLFHVAVPLLLFEFSFVNSRISVQRAPLGIGALLPDLFDKPFALLGLWGGRGFFHAPFFWLAVFIPVYWVFKNRAIFNGLVIGTLFHLILDLPYIPLLWPFFNYDFMFPEDPFGFWLYALTHNPLIIATELGGLFVIAGIIMHHRLLWHWLRIKEFIFSPTIQAQKSRKDT